MFITILVVVLLIVGIVAICKNYDKNKLEVEEMKKKRHLP